MWYRICKTVYKRSCVLSQRLGRDHSPSHLDGEVVPLKRMFSVHHSRSHLMSCWRPLIPLGNERQLSTCGYKSFDIIISNTTGPGDCSLFNIGLKNLVWNAGVPLPQEDVMWPLPFASDLFNHYRYSPVVLLLATLALTSAQVVPSWRKFNFLLCL